MSNSPSSSFAAATEIAFVDAGVADSASLLSQFQPGTEVHLLNASDNAIDQITAILADRSGVSSLHIISHGSDGALQLGGQTVVDFGDYDTELMEWSKSLTADADILLYGCNVAADAVGKAFVNQLAQQTGADVAASDDLTGQGGDWKLEYQTGTIETAAIADASYASTLANFRVTTLSDVVNPNDGVISLREAVSAANTLGGSNNIFFNVNGTVLLSNGELGISSNLSIYGNGASFSTISGNNVSRVFNVSSGTVLLSGLTIANGQAANDIGGGIRNSGNLTVQFCTLSNNSSTFGGGGIYNGGTLTVNSSTLSNNSSTFGGGGIDNRGTVAVNSSTLSNNSAGSGGGIFNNGTLTVNSSTLSNNSAGTGGGGILNDGTVTVNSSTLSNNSSTFGGGGIFNDGTVTVNSSTLSNNSAGGSGGGINNFGTLTATGSLFTGNSTNGNGGGIYSNNEAVVNFCTFTNNQAGDDGGGLYDEGGVLSLLNSTFQGNRATAEGGGLYLTGSNAKVSASTFLSNQAASGGAIGLGVSSGSSTLLVTDSVLRFNSATTSGGGIFAGAGDSVTIRRSQVRQNTAPVGVDLFGAYISGGFNLIGKGGGFTGIVNGVNGDVILVV